MHRRRFAGADWAARLRSASVTIRANLCNHSRPAYEPADACHAATSFSLTWTVSASRTRPCSHPAVFTVEEARTLRGQIAGGHTKNLFLRDKKGALYLVVAPEDATIELKSLHRLLGASGRFSFGSAALLRETLGVEPGSVTPFAVINDKAGQVTVILDAAMMAHEMLNFHPLVNTGTTTISREGLLKFLEATGHGRGSSRFPAAAA